MVNEKKPSQLERLKQMAGPLGVDVDVLVDEIGQKAAERAVDTILPHIKQGQEAGSGVIAQVQKEMVEFNEFKRNLPALMEKSARDTVAAVIEEYKAQAVAATPAVGGDGAVVATHAGLGGLLNPSLLNPQLISSIAQLVQAFKGNAGLGQSGNFNTLMNGIGIGLKLKQTPEAFDDIKKQIGDSLNPPK